MIANYVNKFYKDYEDLQGKYDKKCSDYKHMELRALVAEDEQRRLEKIVKDKEEELQKDKNMVKELEEKIAGLQKENERLKVIQNNDGTTCGIPTSKTPIGKKKVIPNFAKNTGGKIGRKEGHKKDKLERLADEKINEKIEHIEEECPNCQSKNLQETGKVITKDVIDYEIITKNIRHYYKEYKCSCCGKIFHEAIPNHLKEECQYGSNVKTLALTLNNIGNVPFNKIRRIMEGLSMEDIKPCEGYLAKLQKQASKGLNKFINELHQEILKSRPS